MKLHDPSQRGYDNVPAVEIKTGMLVDYSIVGPAGLHKDVLQGADDYADGTYSISLAAAATPPEYC
jgi:hypothetical protein